MYTRVFESILDSSINMKSVPATARWLWIVMMIIGDRNRDGTVDMPVERLASKAGLSVEDTRAALELLGAPDPDSRSSKEEGRRIIPMREAGGRGWILVNYEEYRKIANTEQLRESTRTRVQSYRDRVKNGIEPGLTEGYVYYAAEPSATKLKIGFSKNPWARIREFMTALPAIKLVATERGSLQLESARHRQFEKVRLEGEWFEMCPELEAHIAALAATVGNAVVTTTEPVGNASTSTSSPTPEPKEMSLFGAEAPPSPTAAKRKRSKQSPTEFPEDYEATPKIIEWAKRELRMTEQEIRLETGRCVRHHRSKGNLFVRHELTVMNWLSGRFVGGQRTAEVAKHSPYNPIRTEPEE